MNYRYTALCKRERTWLITWPIAISYVFGGWQSAGLGKMYEDRYVTCMPGQQIALDMSRIQGLMVTDNDGCWYGMGNQGMPIPLDHLSTGEVIRHFPDQ